MFDLIPERLRALLVIRPAPPDATVNGPCWIYIGNHASRNGYGRAWWKGADRALHRILYELLVGPIPDGHQLDHLCRVRPCCNPDHNEPVTPGVNTHRGDAVLYKRPEEYEGRKMAAT